MEQQKLEELKNKAINNPKTPEFIFELLNDAEMLNALIWAATDLSCEECSFKKTCKEQDTMTTNKCCPCLDMAIDYKDQWVEAFRVHRKIQTTKVEEYI